jgi:hypothetical protein
MVFGQFLRQESFSIGLALSGLSVRLVLVGLTVILAGGKR